MCNITFKLTYTVYVYIRAAYAIRVRANLYAVIRVQNNYVRRKLMSPDRQFF